MSERGCIVARVVAGRIDGHIRSGVAPNLILVCGDETLSKATIDKKADEHGYCPFSVDIPASVISDGVVVLHLKLDPTSPPLETVTIIAGHPLHYDLHGEVASLRAELELLKQTIRASSRRSTR